MPPHYGCNHPNLGTRAIINDPDHPRRCRGRSRQRAGERCLNFATPGSNYCRFHGGMGRRKREMGTLGPSLTMRTRYGKYLGPRLKARYEELMQSEDHAAYLKLQDEIQLARSLLAEQIELMTVCVDSKESKKIDDRTKAVVIAHAKEGINQVAELCSKAARIAKDMADKVTVEQMNSLVMQMTNIIAVNVEDEETRLKILRKIDDIRLVVATDPESKAQVVRQTLAAMGDSVTNETKEAK